MQVKNHIDQLLLKTWIMANIPFEVIENPFIIELFKSLNPAYVLHHVQHYLDDY